VIASARPRDRFEGEVLMARPGKLLVAAIAMACGHSTSVQQTAFKLEAPTTPIVMEAGETRTIQLLAIGTNDVVT
jgi:hypothetical protein